MAKDAKPRPRFRPYHALLADDNTELVGPDAAIEAIGDHIESKYGVDESVARVIRMIVWETRALTLDGVAGGPLEITEEATHPDLGVLLGEALGQGPGPRWTPM